MPEPETDDLDLKRQTVKERVADQIRDLILTRELLPGTRIVQEGIAERLGVSRTPVREALEGLASEGFVMFSPYRGASVVEFSLGDVEDIYSVRAALEAHAGYLAAKRVTDDELNHLNTLLVKMEKALEKSDTLRLMELNQEFNSTIFTASRQPRLAELTIKYMHLADLYRRLHFSVKWLAAEAIAEHKEMLEALYAHDAEAVRNLTYLQIERSVTALKDYIEDGK